MADAYQSRQMIFEATEKDRLEWEAITEQPRRLAISADNELRRRHPGARLEPLRSAEPEPVTDAEQAELALAADSARPTPVSAGPSAASTASRRRTRRFRGLLAPGA
jgi:hypothetical protein